jgi:hypothetical protein
VKEGGDYYCPPFCDRKEKRGRGRGMESPGKIFESWEKIFLRVP